jgi:hypothetical protein
VSGIGLLGMRFPAMTGQTSQMRACGDISGGDIPPESLHS